MLSHLLLTSVFVLDLILELVCDLIGVFPGPSTEPSVVESKDRKANAHLILKLMCDSVVLRPHLRELLSAKYHSSYKYSPHCSMDISLGILLKCKCKLLLSHRDARGMTPFMLAVSGRAYPAAITVLEAAQKMAKGQSISYIFFVVLGTALSFEATHKPVHFCHQYYSFLFCLRKIMFCF